MKVGVFFLFIVLILFPSLGISQSDFELVDPKNWYEMPNERKIQILQNEFYSYAVYYTARRGFRFGNGADNMFRDRFAINAAYAMIEKRPENFERAKARIRSNFRMLIDLMIEESGTIPGYQSRHPYVIGEQTLSRALSKICPLWPICD